MANTSAPPNGRNEGGGEPQVRLRRATMADREMLLRWDDDPVVSAASGDADWGWDAALGQQDSWREHLVIEAEGVPVGYVQIMDPAGDPERYWGDVPPGLRAIDIWIGEASARGAGIGTAAMRAVLARCFAVAAVEAVLIDPLVSNTRAIAFYERLGFRAVERRRFPGDEEDCLVMRMDRPRTPATRDPRGTRASPAE